MIAHEIWKRFGNVKAYVEPFAGTAATLLARPNWRPGVKWIEIINDADGFVANFFRALKDAPERVAKHADWPVNESDLHARNLWLTERKESLQSKLEGDPDYYNAKIAGWWVWAMSCKLGNGLCSGEGPWTRKEINGKWHLVKDESKNGTVGITRSIPCVGGRGVHPLGISANDRLLRWMRALAQRLREVRVCCGDWSRVCGHSHLTNNGLTAVMLDPPYAGNSSERCQNVYRVDSSSVSGDVRRWALEHGDNPLLRIALCGYEGEHEMSKDWECLKWKAQGGYANQGSGANKNRKRERIWFSPYCRKSARLGCCP